MDQVLQRQDVDAFNTKFLQNNIRPHIAEITQNKIEELGWELLSHPPYSPDLVLSDYHMFRSVQHSLEEKKYIEKVNIWVFNYFDSRPVGFFVDGIYFLCDR